MLSICIPVYNFEISKLVKELHYQAMNLEKPFEIVIIDDASNDKYKILNRSIATSPNIIYEELSENIGRSCIRNLLKDRSQYSHLLFLDCDVLITRIDFLSNYIEFIENELNKNFVVCGGHTYLEKPTNNSLILHWLWGIKREALNADVRQKKPYQSFMTSNFVITKSVLNRNPFNENLSGYGHEDTLLGSEMQKLNIPIMHIDNPVEHIGLEEASVILEKTHQSIKNLIKIYHLTKKDKKFLEISKLLKTYDKIKRFRINKIIRFFFAIFKKLIEHNLKSSNPSIFLFDLYKLGIICKY